MRKTQPASSSHSRRQSHDRNVLVRLVHARHACVILGEQSELGHNRPCGHHPQLPSTSAWYAHCLHMVYALVLFGKYMISAAQTHMVLIPVVLLVLRVFSISATFTAATTSKIYSTSATTTATTRFLATPNEYAGISGENLLFQDPTLAS